MFIARFRKFQLLIMTVLLGGVSTFVLADVNGAASAGLRLVAGMSAAVLGVAEDETDVKNSNPEVSFLKATSIIVDQSLDTLQISASNSNQGHDPENGPGDPGQGHGPPSDNPGQGHGNAPPDGVPPGPPDGNPPYGNACGHNPPHSGCPTSPTR